jgi:hypothetical protein
MLTRVDLLQALYTDESAALLYDCITNSPAGTIRTAEFFGLRDAKIATIRLVFDATPLRQAMPGRMSRSSKLSQSPTEWRPRNDVRRRASMRHDRPAL